MKREMNLMNQTLRSFAAAIAGVAIFTGQANAAGDVLTQWTFETSLPETAGPHVAEVGTGSASGFHAAGATVYSNPAGNGSAESYSSNTWTVGDYYLFHSSTTGFSNIGVQFDHVSSTTGPRDFALQYSTNGTTFTDFANYMVLPNAAPAWSSAGTVLPLGMDTYSFDLTSISALNSAANVYFRLNSTSTASANGTGTVPVAGTSRVDNVTIFNNFVADPPPVTPVFPAAGDVVFGANSNRGPVTLQVVSGPANGAGANPTPYSPWQSTPFVQSVEFDNLGGTAHNVSGNLLGVDFGANATVGGTIYSFATQGSVPAPAGQAIGNTTGTGGAGVSASRLAGLSVSPDNSKIAVTGFDTGSVIVYDYTAGNTMGSGASLSGGRESAATLDPTITQGTTWVDDNTVLTLSSAGSLSTVDATSMAVTSVGSSLTPPSTGSTFTSLYYNPAVSDYVWAMSSGFSGSAESALYVLDPDNNFALVDDATYISSTDSAREIALDADGNLFIGGNGSDISVVLGAAGNVGSLADDDAVFWYNAPLFLTGSNFNGLDVGFASSAGQPGDYNGDGVVSPADYNLWKAQFGTAGTLQNAPATPGIVDAADYTVWRDNLNAATPGGGSLSAVPEPAGFALLLVGVVGLWCSRRGGSR